MHERKDNSCVPPSLPPPSPLSPSLCRYSFFPRQPPPFSPFHLSARLSVHPSGMVANVRRSLYFFNRYIFSVSGRSGPLADRNVANEIKKRRKGGRATERGGGKGERGEERGEERQGDVAVGGWGTARGEAKKKKTKKRKNEKRKKRKKKTDADELLKGTFGRAADGRGFSLKFFRSFNISNRCLSEYRVLARPW